MRKLKCSSCSSPLSLHESDFDHGWQTTFSIKCLNCHLVHANFPSYKPMGVPPQSTNVNVHHPVRAMNEVTMRSVLAVHCSGFSTRDLHKFATIFDMPPPQAYMPPRYLNKIESTVENACQKSMNAAAVELHLKPMLYRHLYLSASTLLLVSTHLGKLGDSIPTLDLVPQFLPPARKFSTTWFSIASVRSAIDGTTNGNRRTQRPTNNGTRPTNLTATRISADPVRPWNLQRLRSSGIDLFRNINSAIPPSLETGTPNHTSN